MQKEEQNNSGHIMSAVAELDYSPISCLDPRTILVRGRYQTVKCGKCYLCQKKRKHDWLNRIHEHIKHNKKTFWITLTYRDEDIPIDYLDISEDIRKEDIKPVQVLRHSDFQLFMKRIRKELPKCTYYMVGEYGPTTHRPHYHMLLFLTDYVTTEYMLGLLDKHWVFGFYMCKQPEWQQIDYAVKYMMFTSDMPHYLRQRPPYMRCSKGIGIGFLTPDMLDRYNKMANSLNPSEFKECTYYVKENFKFGLPRYYKDRIFTDAQKAKIKHVSKDKPKELREHAETIIETARQRLEQKLKNNTAYDHDYKNYYQTHLEVNEKCIDRIRNIREQEKRFINKSKKSRVI